jgi:hypothetical protein
MIALIRLVLAVLASPFKSKSRLEAILSELRVSFRHGFPHNRKAPSSVNAGNI